MYEAFEILGKVREPGRGRRSSHSCLTRDFKVGKKDAVEEIFKALKNAI
jgi:hypothetical protein